MLSKAVQFLGLLLALAAISPTASTKRPVFIVKQAGDESSILFDLVCQLLPTTLNILKEFVNMLRWHGLIGKLVQLHLQQVEAPACYVCLFGNATHERARTKVLDLPKITDAGNA